jgi:hypothetical protein
VKIAQYGSETWYSRPKDYFAHGGRLARLLLEGHEGVELDPESRQRIIDWLDLNAPLYGTYSWNKDEWRRPDPDGEQALRAHIRQRFGDELAGQPFAALVNVALPDESRILKAPLAIEAGGWGQIEQGGWNSQDDPEYQKMRRLVHSAIQPLPYQDIAGTCGRDERCLCLSCWVRKLAEEQFLHLDLVYYQQWAGGKERLALPLVSQQKPAEGHIEIERREPTHAIDRETTESRRGR